MDKIKFSSSANTVINPKPCNYNCGTRIYWDTSSNSYLEVFTKKKHICPNRSSSNNNNNNNNKNSSICGTSSASTINKPKYYMFDDYKKNK